MVGRDDGKLLLLAYTFPLSIGWVLKQVFTKDQYWMVPSKLAAFPAWGKVPLQFNVGTVA